MKACAEIVDFIAAASISISVIAFRPSEAARARVSALISQEKSEGLDVAEKAELDHSIQMEYLMRLVKAQARKFLESSGGTMSVETEEDQVDA